MIFLALPNRRPYTRKRMKHFDVEGVYYELKGWNPKKSFPNWHERLNFFCELYNSLVGRLKAVQLLKENT